MCFMPGFSVVGDLPQSTRAALDLLFLPEPPVAPIAPSEPARADTVPAEADDDP